MSNQMRNVFLFFLIMVFLLRNFINYFVQSKVQDPQVGWQCLKMMDLNIISQDENKNKGQSLKSLSSL